MATSKKDLTAAMEKNFVRFQGGQALVPPNADIKPVEVRALKGANLPTYRQVKSTFKQDLGSRDARFTLSDLVVGQLSVEEEEERRFAKRVEDEVTQRLSFSRQEAQKSGLEEGLREGKERAYSEEKARLAKELESLASTVNVMQDAKAKLAAEYEGALVDLAFRFAEVIVHRDLRERPEGITSTIQAILERFAKDDDVRIRLPSESFEVMQLIKDDLAKVSRSGRISFDIDRTLTSGSCVVESLSGEVASFIEEKIALLRTELKTLGKKAAS